MERAHQQFVAARRGRPVARCTAIVDPQLAERAIGIVGHFESENDPEAAIEVLEMACEWLACCGAVEIWGPIDGSIWHGYRLMTRGFATEPFLGEPRNPPSWPGYFAAAGFDTLARWRSWDVPAQLLERLAGAARAVPVERLADAGLSSRPFDLDRADRDLALIADLALECFAGNVGFTSIDRGELVGLLGSMLPLMRSEMTRLVFADGEPVGFGHSYPDPETGKAVLHTIALVPRVRRLGAVEALLLAPAFEYMLEHCDGAVGGLACEGPTLFDKIGEATREYSLFARAM